MQEFAVVQKHPRFRVSVPIDVITMKGEVEQLRLEDISLGGVFIRTTLPEPPGSFVAMKLPLGEPQRALSLMGRVVHVIDGAQSVAKARAPGMGVQFDGLSPDAERLLRSFVDGLVEEERRLRARRDGARFIDLTHVEIAAERASLSRMWREGLEHGTVFAHGEGKLGNRVAVTLGPLQLGADVVRVHDSAGTVVGGDDGTGATLMLTDFVGAKHDAVRRYVEGITDRIVVDVAGAGVVDAGNGLKQALADARRLYRGVDDDDLYGALGLLPDADAAAIEERANELCAAFEATHIGASAPQRARLQAAVRVVGEVAASLRERARASREGGPVDDGGGGRDQVNELLAEAEFLESVGKREEAQKCLLDAFELAPGDDAVTRKLFALNDRIDAAFAMTMLKSADGQPMKDMVDLAKRAARLSSSRDVLLRAMRMLSSAGADDDTIAVANILIDENPDDELPLFAIFHLHEQRKEWVLAAKAGEALLRIRPDDFTLRERVLAVVELARTKPS